jgi:hypothetical protein
MPPYTKEAERGPGGREPDKGRAAGSRTRARRGRETSETTATATGRETGDRRGAEGRL